MREEDMIYGGVEIGDRIFDDDGRVLGRVRGVDASGFYVLGTEETDRAPITEIRDVTGTAYLMWRCWDCGEMGEIEAELPEACPNCGAPRESLYYWAED